MVIMSDRLDHLHFLLIPFLSQGHILPLTNFAQLLAEQNVIVSIIITPRNCARYEKVITHAVESGLKLRVIPIDFPGQEAGLPQGCEEIDSQSSADLYKGFFTACEMLAPQLETLMAEMHPKPSCIVSTNALPWTQRVADKFNIPRYIFETVSSFTLLCSHLLSKEMALADLESYVVPNIPHTIEFPKAQLHRPKTKSLDITIENMIEQTDKAPLLARATLINSFEEMDGAYAEGYKKIAKKSWCIGPVSVYNKSSSRGSKASTDEHHCISWLNDKEAKSVIYACFGSFCRISDEQIKEIGLGLEASNLPFIWVIRGMDSSPEVKRWLEEEKIEERVEGRGLIIRGWAPQVLILSHPSVGGFMTHCGWNSTLEGVSAGVPMLTWPMFAEQFYNEKYVVNVLGIGVRVGVEVEAKNEPLVNRGRVKKAIEGLMEEGEEGRERRTRAKKLADMARVTLKEGGSSYMNIKLFIQDVASCVL